MLLSYFIRYLIFTRNFALTLSIPIARRKTFSRTIQKTDTHFSTIFLLSSRIKRVTADSNSHLSIIYHLQSCLVIIKCTSNVIIYLSLYHCSDSVFQYIIPVPLYSICLFLFSSILLYLFRNRNSVYPAHRIFFAKTIDNYSIIKSERS